MKKISILFLLSLLLLPSCSKNKGLIIENAQKAAEDRPTAEEGYEYLIGVGNWLNSETEYVSYPDENIVRLIGNGLGNIYNGDLYFQLQKEESKQDETGYYYTSGKPVYAYISRITGEKHFLCPDPLCTHGAYSGCQYLNLDSLVEGENGIMYATKTEMPDGVPFNVIYEINTSTGTLIPIYTADTSDDTITSHRTNLSYVYDNKLYYYDRISYEYLDENGDVLQKSTQQFMSLDLTTKETETLSSEYSNNINVIGKIWDKMLIRDNLKHQYYLTDFNLVSREAIYINFPSGGYYLSNAYYDKNTEELYILYVSTMLNFPEKMDMSDEDIPSYLYKVSKDLTVEELTLPDELVMSIQLTEEYIYYTKFDPIYYGSRSGHIITDETGTKIYRVSRDDLTTSELYFD